MRALETFKTMELALKLIRHWTAIVTLRKTIASFNQRSRTRP